MEINFPKSFPQVTQEQLLQPLSEFERENNITQIVRDNSFPAKSESLLMRLRKQISKVKPPKLI